jgi:hypothetical protein
MKTKREDTVTQQRHEMKQVLKKELEWMQKAPRARETKSVKRTKEFVALENEYTTLKKLDMQRKKKIEISLEKRRV